MQLSELDIEEINQSVADSWNEGIFVEPNYVPIHIKEPVIYMRWTQSGYSGGSCWGTRAQYFQEDKPKFTVIDLVLKRIKPDISYLQYKEIEKLIHTNSETEHEYYGNSKDVAVEYIVLSELYEVLDIS